MFVAVVMLAPSIGCDSPAEIISAELGQEVELQPGQIAFIEDEKIKFRFVEVSNDSRCPSGVICVWRGEVTSILEITYLDSSYTKTITQPGLTQHMSTDVFKEYEISHNVLPYPKSGREIKADEYRLQLLVEKKP